ncbi:MAG: fimbrillin family protein [Bacteroides sp.]|jgi:endonuclease G|nr:fimbrillin family protein [Bacteroides sp.]MCI1682054.1 fimbrillin family protein [Bacteroides sp.]
MSLKIKKNRALLLYLLVVALFGCSSKGTLHDTDEQTPVYFSSTVSDNSFTRVSGTNWSDGDQIGVFAIQHAKALLNTNIYGDCDNAPFSTNSNGVFYSTGANIYYPQDDSALDFIAYYPYKSSITNYTYPIDLSKQEDVLYSNNLSGLTQSNSNATLAFKHILSKIIFSVKADNTDASLNGLSATIEGGKTKATLSLANGELTIDETSNGTTAAVVTGSGNNEKEVEIIALPSNKANELTAKFIINGQTYTYVVPDPLVAAKVYKYDITLQGVPPTVKKTSSYMEIPVYTSAETAPHSVSVLHMVGSTSWLNSNYTYTNNNIRNYSILYDTEDRVPYWVAYPLYPIYLATGNRTDAWDYDPDIDKTLQPNLSSTWRQSGTNYNRGHLLASASRNATTSLNKTTFYYTNMCPQEGSMNSGTWADLENKERAWCQDAAYDTLYAVTGCILPEAPETISTVNDVDGKPSVVPKYLYKALLRKNKASGNYTSIAFRMENANTGIPYYNAKYVISVSELEKETGFTFFPNLPDDIASTVKSNTDLTNWN